MNLKDPFSQKIFEVYHVINRTPENIYTNPLLAVDNCTLIAQFISGALHRNRRVKIPARGPSVEFSATVSR